MTSEKGDEMTDGESFLVFTSDKIKMLYADGKSDEEISEILNIPILVIEDTLKSCRLPIRITGIRVVKQDEDAPALLKVMRGNKWPQ